MNLKHKLLFLLPNIYIREYPVEKNVNVQVFYLVSRNR